MATFPSSFRIDSARIHGEHQQLLVELAEMVAALEALDPLSVGRLRRSAARLQQSFPGHFQREEATLLDAVAPVSPELAEFSRQMRQEHQHFLERLSAFTLAAAALESGDHDGASLRQVRQTGETLARDLAAHIALEESQLDGFL